MALRRFSDNPAATTPLSGTEVIPGLQGGTDVQMTAQDIANLAPSGAGTVTSVGYSLGASVADVWAATGSPITTSGTITVSAVDPGADRIVFWDDSDSKLTYLTVGSGLSITGTTLSATGGGTGDVTGPGSSTDNTLVRMDGTTGKVIQGSGVVLSDNDEISGYRGNVNIQTGTTYTVLAADSGKIVDHANASAITTTLPNNLPVGWCCTYAQTGAGQVTFSAASGATLRNRQSHTKIAGQWGEVSLYVRANSGGAAAEYVLAGDTAA